MASEILEYIKERLDVIEEKINNINIKCESHARESGASSVYNKMVWFLFSGLFLGEVFLYLKS